MLSEGKVKAQVVQITSRGRKVHDWVVEDEKNCPNTCLICNHYKYNHDNIRKLGGEYTHICMYLAPKFIDVTKELNQTLNYHCEHFLRRAIL